MMNPEMYYTAAKECCSVYDKNIKLKMDTEYSHKIKMINGKIYQIIAVAGTDSLMDMFKNFNLLSKKGIKKSAYKAAKRIMKNITLYRCFPVIVTGHSLGGAVAIALKKMFKIIDFCIVFAPARCLRYWSNRKMENTAVFIDPDDTVSELWGIISFGLPILPICKVFKALKDHLLYSFSDHKIEKWVKYTRKMIELKHKRRVLN